MNKKPILRSQITEIATSCTCGTGPGCAPLTPPVCPACLQFVQAADRYVLRQLANVTAPTHGRGVCSDTGVTADTRADSASATPPIHGSGSRLPINQYQHKEVA